MVRMRLNGEPLLGGIAGTIQRDNAARLFRGEPRIGLEEAAAAVQRAWPRTTPVQFDAALDEFSDHLEREGTRLTMQAQAMSRLVAANDSE